MCVCFGQTVRDPYEIWIPVRRKGVGVLGELVGGGWAGGRLIPNFLILDSSAVVCVCVCVW